MSIWGKPVLDPDDMENKSYGSSEIYFKACRFLVNEISN